MPLCFTELHLPAVRKRSPSNAFEPSAGLLAIWTPLLTHVYTHHPSFPSILINRLISSIIRSDPEPTITSNDIISLDVADNSNTRDVTFELCAASWVNWLVENQELPSSLTSDEEGEERRLRRANVVASLVSAIGIAKSSSETENKASVDIFNKPPMLTNMSTSPCILGRSIY